MKPNQTFADSIFAWRAADNMSPKQIADAASSSWRIINVALSPIIGQRGVTALFKRSLHMARADYPILKNVVGAAILPGEFGALHAALAKETSENAVLINSTILNTFYELLTHLIGSTLTQQLLNSVFDTPSSGDPAQDTLP